MSCRKTFFLSLILVLLSLFLVTPLFIYKHILDESNPLLRIINQYLPLIILVLVNVVIIPFFVDVAAALMDNETKSSMQTKIMYMNLILMHVNMIILPLTGLVTYEQLIYQYKRSPTFEFVTIISANLGTMAAFITTYLVQLVFITNCIQMLDVPHFIIKSFFTLVNWVRHRPYKDDWSFQLGYYQSFTFTVMTLALMFSVAMPISTFFAFIFFMTRYQIEKYNFLFVYHQ